MRKTDIAYLAGFFDGEGSVMLSRNKSGGLSIAVACSQNTRTVLDIYVRAFGGNVYEYRPPSRNSSMFQWRANGQVGIDALCSMRPWLLVKALSSDEAFNAWECRYTKATVESLVLAHRARVHAEREAR